MHYHASSLLNTCPNPNIKPTNTRTNFDPTIPQIISIPPPPHRREKCCVPALCSLQSRPTLDANDAAKKLAISPSLFLSSFTSTFQKFLITTFSKVINPPLPSSVDPNLVFTGNFTPVDELEPTSCVVVQGELPASLNGVYVRNGPNPQHKPTGPLHFFEGDGMLHSLKISRGQAIFCSRYVKTYKYVIERQAGFPIFPNVLSGFYSLAHVLGCVVAIGRVMCGHIDLIKGFGLANTSLAFFSHKLVALGESDLPYVIDLTKEGNLETLGRWDFSRKPFASMTAHPKIDKETEETFAFQCNPLIFPYITYFYFNEDGVKQKDVPILSINQPSLIHDFAITKSFAIFAETNLVFAPPKLMLGRGKPLFCDPTKVPRIGVLPRYASSDRNMKWFPVPGFNAMHVINAWENEDDDEIVLVAPNVLDMENVFDQIDKVHFSLEKITINLATGSTSRRVLSNRNLELGSVNPSYVGRNNRYAYLGIVSKIPKMSGIAKIDFEKETEVSRRFYEPGCYGGEPLFVPRDGNGHQMVVDEDDGFVVSYVHDENSGESSFLVMDAKSPNLDIVANVKLPRRVPYGFHSLFVSENSLSNQ